MSKQVIGRAGGILSGIIRRVRALSLDAAQRAAVEAAILARKDPSMAVRFTRADKKRVVAHLAEHGRAVLVVSKRRRLRLYTIEGYAQTAANMKKNRDANKPEAAA